MDLLCISDLHGRSGILDRMKKPAEDADVFIVSGDITNFGKRTAAEDVVERLLRLNDSLLAIPGNCDTPEVNDVLQEFGVSIHGRGVVKSGVAFFGVGGSTITPFNTPQEYREESLGELLKKGYEAVKACKMKVMVSHTPPWGTKADLTRSGLHVGSWVVRAFLEEHNIALVVCGHVHEAKGKDVLKGSWIVNPGPGHMGFARVSLSDRIVVDLVDLY